MWIVCCFWMGVWGCASYSGAVRGSFINVCNATLCIATQVMYHSSSYLSPCAVRTGTVWRTWVPTKNYESNEAFLANFCWGESLECLCTLLPLTYLEQHGIEYPLPMQIHYITLHVYEDACTYGDVITYDNNAAPSPTRSTPHFPPTHQPTTNKQIGRNTCGEYFDIQNDYIPL